MKRTILLLMLILFSLNLIAEPVKLDTTRKTRPKVGLVLSGGGAKGFAHIGALKVIRDAGIEVDYVAGTSMGSIVGGLYAIGYSPEFIENLVRSQNWTDLLLDKISRRQLSLDEKNYNEQQFISFPVTKEKISLPFGIKYGQNISLLLSTLTTPVYQHHSFKDFQTPFLCIGTAIANGESVIIEDGSLAEAMRASMAIPTVFTPVVVKGKLVVDGGLVNNFPAKELAERGCDIIIGVDVQSHIDYKVEDLNTITSILDRSAGFYRKALNDTAMKYVDYYIQPDITGYGVGSFADYDSIMLRGERAGLKNKSRLDSLASYLKKFPDYELKIRDLQPISHFVLDSVVVVGNEIVSTQTLKKLFNEKKGDVVEIEDLEGAIEQVYGSLFFKTAKYSLIPGKQGAILKIEVEEDELGSIGLGLHYDSDYKAGILVTSRFRNLLFKNTLLETTLGLSENPHLGLKYYQNRSLLPSFGFATKWFSFSFIDYLNGKDKVGEYQMSNLLVELYLQSISRRNVSLGGGVQMEVSSLRNNIGIDFGVNNSQFSQSFFNFFAFLKVDRWDHSFFPTRGGKVDVNAVFITEFLQGGNLNFGEKATILSGTYDKAIPLSSKWTFRPRVSLGLTFGTGIYVSHMFMLGGQGAHYLPGMTSFSGLNVFQLYGTQMLAGRLRLQYNIHKRHYLMATVDVGNTTFIKSDLFYVDNSAIGYGLTWGYDSVIGPVELSVMGSNYRTISGFLNIGFWF
ncbi:hypothetical protein HNS38_06030 [Lentimicrobium sp. L6]|uniref:patatin-like phospholipase family protein n=2 Tax=unclassified Lentimicrobium TaxID=2677434 RepID=UPI001557D693|nr:patatin-like phospholipase family protein [Lentimicrobium sp. L6]NPD44429.1 hypothetical protein [Lentimicrobium sp. S6]NPD84305.1 hypothetical protein [Lentimicrobium sp. L6]